MTYVAQVMTQIARMDAAALYAYRVNFGMHLAGRLLQIYLLKVVWTTVYAGRSAVDGVPLDVLIAYITLANLQTWVIYPEAMDVIPQRVRTGAVALDLARPVGLVPQLIARSIGRSASVLTFGLITLPFAAVLGSLRPPASVEAAALYAVSILLAYGIAIGIGVLLSLVSFWTLETNGIGSLWLFVDQFFAGALVPFWFFPDWLRTIAELLPFQTQAFLPLSIYFGRLSGADAVRALAVAFVWLVIIWLGTLALWGRTSRRIQIQGG